MNYNQDIINIYKNLAVITKKYPERLIDVLQCFNQNQYKCKTWLVDKLNKYPYHFKMKSHTLLTYVWHGHLKIIVVRTF